VSIDGLAIDELTVRFGGLTAVDSVSLAAPRGRVTGLIGPNGAGKTTTFNACSGLVRPTSGSVVLDGDDITGLGVPARARRGLGRTFQRMELFESLTVAENVSLGREAGLAGGHVLRQLAGTRRERIELRDAVDGVLGLCGIRHLASSPVGALSTGQRRVVELARTLAGRFSILLLDEPSSGLDRAETAAFGDVLRAVVQDRKCGVLLVEHDIDLVMGVSAHIYVLDFGVRIFDGPPSAVQASDVVRRAYLGAGAA
jgi:ABC-type branched-subunit amino acid transport system ATPase component